MRVLFIDRDGTLINEPPDGYIDTLEKLEILPHVIESLPKLQEKFTLVLVSNQPGRGTNKFTEESFIIPQNKLVEIFNENNISFKQMFFCPHFREDNCECMKPKTGLIDSFLKENTIELQHSYVIGDRETDIQLAKNIGCKGILYSDKKVSDADFISHDWRKIVDYILHNL
ncbi:MAG TPA: histidinol-phosphatase [Candidatus Nitrosocosmicus sp.]|nr:histidinol-phosphatase [Candidatus Nitrosocosmicus sp.]